MKRLLNLFLATTLVLTATLGVAYGKMAPGPSKDPLTGKDYAGSEKCGSCHKKEYAEWKKTIHAWMIRPIARGDLKNAKADLTIENSPKPDQYDWAYVI